MRSLAAVVTALLVVLGGGSLVASASAEEVNPWLDMRVMNMAHSGGEDEAPMNTLYAFKRAKALGADMLELDVQSTQDGRLVVIHDATVDRTTEGSGRVVDMTLAEVQRLDAAHWFVPGRSAVHGEPADSYPLRGARHGDVVVDGYAPDDFAVPTLDEVLGAFPDTPINIEIKGTRDSDLDSYLRTGQLLSDLINRSGRTDIIVGSFNDAALADFHTHSPQIGLSTGRQATTDYVIAGTPPPPGTVALQVPVNQLGFRVITPELVERAHRDGLAVHAWFSGTAPDDADTYSMIIDTCVDGLMPAKPSVLEEILDARGIERPGSGLSGTVPGCGTPAPTSSDPSTTDDTSTADPTSTTDPTSTSHATSTTAPTSPRTPALVQTDSQDAPGIAWWLVVGPAVLAAALVLTQSVRTTRGRHR